jgi:hypothetical protein
LKTSSGLKWFYQNVEGAIFFRNKSIISLINETENLYIKELQNGDRQKGMKRLRVPPLAERKSYWTSFKVKSPIQIIFV